MITECVLSEPVVSVSLSKRGQSGDGGLREDVGFSNSHFKECGAKTRSGKNIISPPAVFDHTKPNRELSYFNNKTLHLQSEEASQSRLGPEPELLTGRIAPN